MSYDKNSIETLEFKEAVRKRISMYMGSADNQGVLQCIREIITNSIDEYTMGFGSVIEVGLNGNTVSVRDYARGVPFGTRDDGVDSMIAVYTMPHSGGKFDNKTYQNVAGLNGIGGKGVALSSKSFKAVSYRDGEEASLLLEKGEVISFKKESSKKQNGTYVEFTPDESVYNLEPISIDYNEIKNMCEVWAYLSPGLTFVLENKKTKEKNRFSFKNGIKDLIANQISKPIHKTILYNKVEDENGNRIEVALQWSKERIEKPFVFTNGLENSNGGTSLTGAKTALTRTVNLLAGTKLSGETLRTGLHYALNASVVNPSFSDQTKTKINNPELRGLADKAITEILKNFAKNNSKEWESIIEVLIKEQKAEQAAERAREAILTAEKEVSQVKKKNFDMPVKAVDATNKTGYREIFLTEGDSASAYLKSTRDAATQAIMPLRGKILNTYDLEFHEAYENQEVKDIFTLLGCGAGNAFNLKKLRYDKIIIASDSDEDGGHISLLLIALFLAHAPQLITGGYLYRVIAPFYKYKNTYFYSDEELNDYLKLHPNIEYARYKGLGAMNEEEVSELVMGGKRKLVQIKLDDLTQATEMFDIFLGKDAVRRKELVEEGEWLYD